MCRSLDREQCRGRGQDPGRRAVAKRSDRSALGPSRSMGIDALDHRQGDGRVGRQACRLGAGEIESVPRHGARHGARRGAPDAGRQVRGVHLDELAFPAESERCGDGSVHGVQRRVARCRRHLDPWHCLRVVVLRGEGAGGDHGDEGDRGQLVTLVVELDLDRPDGPARVPHGGRGGGRSDRHRPDELDVQGPRRLVRCDRAGDGEGPGREGAAEDRARVARQVTTELEGPAVVGHLGSSEELPHRREDLAGDVPLLGGRATVRHR